MISSSLLALVILSSRADANELPPCYRDGDRISCESEAFRTLKDTCMGAKGDFKVCTYKLGDMTKDAHELALHVQLLEAELANVPRASPRRALLGYGVTVASTALLTSLLFTHFTASSTLAVGGIGLAGVGTGLFLVLP